jgi:hypothetical protein
MRKYALLAEQIASLILMTRCEYRFAAKADCEYHFAAKIV